MQQVSNLRAVSIQCVPVCMEQTQTLNLTFLNVTVSTLKPTVGMVDTFWPSFSLYRMAVSGKKKIQQRIRACESDLKSEREEGKQTGLASRVKTEHENTHLLVPKQLCKERAHVCCAVRCALCVQGTPIGSGIKERERENAQHSIAHSLWGKKNKTMASKRQRKSPLFYR